jgi:hypothetical protein
MPSRVGRPVIEDILIVAPVPWRISGGIAALAPAGMDAPGDNLAPDVLVRLLWLLLPAVLAVVAPLAVALPVQGFSASAALRLTPLLNAAAIPARSRLVRVEHGRTPVVALDLRAISRRGCRGNRPSQRCGTSRNGPARPRWPRGWTTVTPGGRPGACRKWPPRRPNGARLPVSPATATAERAAMTAFLEPWEVDSPLAACRVPLTTGAPGCMRVVADVWPAMPGNAVALFARADDGWLRVDAHVPRGDTRDRRG